jgi:hypothetical protein
MREDFNRSTPVEASRVAAQIAGVRGQIGPPR